MSLTHSFNTRLVFRVMGALLIIEAFFMFLATAVSFGYGEWDSQALLISSVLSLVGGLLGMWIGRDASKKYGHKESYLIVAMTWVVFSFFGMMPYYFSGIIPNYTDAFFETIAGFTTTGCTILQGSFENYVPHGLLFWRATTQWLGGMGIIVLSLAILPMFGFSGMQLYTAEVTGPTYEKLTPQIQKTAGITWGLYFILTFVEAIMLKLCGMNFFDAICHSFSTIATGGFSTKGRSLVEFQTLAQTDPSIHYIGIEYTIMLFMLLSGINFAILYFVIFKHRFRRLWEDEECRWYLSACVIVGLIVSVGLFVNNYSSATEEGMSVAKLSEESFRHGMFTTIATITTTAFANCDYTTWQPFMWTIIFFLMLTGGSAGSTSGGIKWVRISIFVKNGFAEFKRLIHPSAVIPPKINGKVIRSATITNVMAFFQFYIIIVAGATLSFTAMGVSFDEAVSVAFATIGNIGPGLGQYGPMGCYANFPLLGKWVMAFVMLVGRLELFTVLLLFSRELWKK